MSRSFFRQSSGFTPYSNGWGPDAHLVVEDEQTMGNLLQQEPISQRVMPGVGEFATDTATHQSKRSRLLISFTPKDCGLLTPPLLREWITTSVWRFVAGIEANTLGLFAGSLRQNLNVDFAVRLIQAIGGVGYTLRAEGEA